MSINASLQQMAGGISKVIRYGQSAGDFTGKAVKAADGKDTPFLIVQLTNGTGGGYIHTQLVGDYNLPNVLAAVAVGEYFCIEQTAIRNALEAYKPANSRSQFMEKYGNYFILDAYNANPSSMRAAIENFAGITASDKVLMLGAMAELGEESLAEHRNIVNLIGQYKWKAVVLVGGNFSSISHPHIQLANSALAHDWLQKQNFKGVHLLIKGSRSMQMESVL